MTALAITVSAEAQQELARAFEELRPQMPANAAADADLDPESRFDARLASFSSTNAHELTGRAPTLERERG